MNEPTPQQSATSEAALEAARREKLRKIREMGIDPWGSRFDDHQPIGEIRAREAEIIVQPAEQKGDRFALPERPEGGHHACMVVAQSETVPLLPAHPPEQHGPKVRAAGRIVLRRPSGKVHWLQVRDWTGTIQVMIGKAQVGDDNFALAQCLDLGDLVGVDGELRRTMKGELTIFAEDLKFLAKSIATPPEKHKGLADPELRQRRRYLDLIHTDGVLETFLRRTKIVQSIRNTLAGRGFVEVEGPTLHAIAGGAAARPFITHHNALDIDLYLRIALELHLKRLLVGGIERVYELGRVYRNEGIDARHNPEFTMLEVYQAYGNYETMMELTEAVIVDAIQATGQGMKLPWGDKEVDFTPPFARKTYDELFAEHTGLKPDDAAAIRKLAEQIGFNTVGKHPDVVKSFVFEEKVEDALVGPIFVTDYPASICPLTKRKTSNPAIAERFELFIQGMEVANAYTELNDPDFRRSFSASNSTACRKRSRWPRWTAISSPRLRNGMPPAGGLGIGIDRLVMLLTNSQSIREVILFPLLRPEAEVAKPQAANP